MSNPINAVRMSGVPNLPQEIPAEVPAVAPVEPEAADPAAAANRAAREQFVETLGTMDGLSPRFLDYVRERLGLTGRTEVAAQPLEEREVNEILADAQQQAAAGALQVSETVSEAVAREIEDAFEKGEKASLGDVLAELASVLPSETLPAAAKMAFEIFREEMKAHLREMRGLTMGEAMRTGRGKDCGEAFAQYADSILGLVRMAAVEPCVDFTPVLSTNFSKMKMMTILCASLLKIAEVVMKLRADIVRYRTVCALAKAKEEAAIGNLKIHELIKEIKEAFIELDERIQKLKKEVKKDSTLVVALQATAAKHLEAEICEWRKIVSGFEAREDRLHEETRDEMAEIAAERERIVERG